MALGQLNLLVKYSQILALLQVHSKKIEMIMNFSCGWIYLYNSDFMAAFYLGISNWHYATFSVNQLNKSLHFQPLLVRQKYQWYTKVPWKRHWGWYDKMTSVSFQLMHFFYTWMYWKLSKLIYSTPKASNNDITGTHVIGWSEAFEVRHLWQTLSQETSCSSASI